MLHRFLFTLLLLLPAAAIAHGHPGDRLIDYTLEVSFHIEALKIRGVATIPFFLPFSSSSRSHPSDRNKLIQSGERSFRGGNKELDFDVVLQ
jgi:hypothetical protein